MMPQAMDMDLETERAGASEAEGAQRITARRLHLVRVDGIEYFYFDLAPALDLLAEEPDAEFELVTVH